MGFRTVVILNNDRAHEWEYDANLGRLISADMHRSRDARTELESSGYGRVVECTHADTQTLAVIDSLQFVPAAYGQWSRNSETENELKIKLLRAAAEHLGYRLVKKPSKTKI